MTDEELMTAEQQAVNTMLSHGIDVAVDTRGLIRLLGKKAITFHIRQPYLGTLMELSRIYLEMELDELKLKDSALQGSYMLVPANARRAARLIATAVLNGRLRIRLFRPLLARWFLWHVTPDTLFRLMATVLMIGNTASFTNSIRLIQALRVSNPKNLIEKD